MDILLKDILLRVVIISKQKQLGEVLKDIGIKRAKQNAESKHKDWTNKAIEFLKKYPVTIFMTENLREWSHKNGLPKPPHPRAWGGVIVKAKKDKLIKHINYGLVVNPKAHRTPASIWKKITFPSDATSGVHGK